MNITVYICHIIMLGSSRAEMVKVTGCESQVYQRSMHNTASYISCLSLCLLPPLGSDNVTAGTSHNCQDIKYINIRNAIKTVPGTEQISNE